MSKGDKKRRRALEAYGSLQRAASLAAATVDDAVQPFGLSASQFGVLETLQLRGPVHQQELAGALHRSKAQMTAIIDALEARGCVRRERHATDRRFISVYLTEAGRAILAQAGPARADAIVALMRELSGEQRGRLTRLCRRLMRALDPEGTDADAAEAPSAHLAMAPDRAATDAHDDGDDDEHAEHAELAGGAPAATRDPAPAADIAPPASTHGAA